MALIVSTLFLITILIFVVIQDLKHRTIHVVLPILIFVLSVLINNASKDLNFSDTLYNILFVIINIIGLTIYFSLKNRALVNPIDSYIGLGDILFFLALTPLFNLKSFILFFIFGLLFSLLVHVVFTRFIRMKTIPLAGYLALFLIVNVGIKNIFKINVLYY